MVMVAAAINIIDMCISSGVKVMRLFSEKYRSNKYKISNKIVN